jgi:hypothetical protein
VWQYLLGGRGVASAAHDPRGGAWVFAFGDPRLRRVSTTTGVVRQTIDLGGLLGVPGPLTPISAMSITKGPAGRPIMLVTVRASQSAAYVVAVDLVKETALWTYKLPGANVRDNTPMGQFPIVRRKNGGRAVVFSMKSGVRALSQAPPLSRLTRAMRREDE